MKSDLRREPSSFRDRDGYIFYENNRVLRRIHPSYKKTWDALNQAAFFRDLVKEGKLVSYDVLSDAGNDPETYKTLEVQKIPFISYPSEWTFGQLKKAALLTLSIQQKALQNGFSLKDASAYNVQFIGHRAIFIDTLSFEPYEEGKPWQAYKQFCQHFLGPLLLCSYGKQELKSLFVDHIDGIPVDLCARLLPFRARFNMLAYAHIRLHARFEKKHAANTTIASKKLSITKARSLSILEHLSSGIKNLGVKKSDTNWTDYYDTFSYSENGYKIKTAFVEKQVRTFAGQLCVDLGANTGEFSRLAAGYFKSVLACDSDLEVVKAIQSKKTENVLALHIDLLNPTPSYGWNNEERRSFISRISDSDLTLALALIHHLCIGNNVPLDKAASFFANCSQNLVIEFVPKHDVQVKKLLITKKDVFDDYSLENFKKAFSNYFSLLDEETVPGSDRTLFLFKKN